MMSNLNPPIPQKTRLAVLQRAQGRCEECEAPLPLELHHLHYDSVGCETPLDLSALCRDCHKHRHIDINGDWWNDPEEMFHHWFTYEEEMAKD
jgi:5-methylcytosine-specific restriction endonuclease McrA